MTFDVSGVVSVLCVDFLQACGSYRRGKSHCGDVDVLIRPPEGLEVREGGTGGGGWERLSQAESLVLCVCRREREMMSSFPIKDLLARTRRG